MEETTTKIKSWSILIFNTPNSTHDIYKIYSKELSIKLSNPVLSVVIRSTRGLSELQL